MTPAQIARLAALAPPDPDPARCGAAWWAQDGTRDAVCGPGGTVEKQAEGEAA